MADDDPPVKKDFFISYNKADREWAEWIAQQLEQAGNYSVVIQAWDFRPGGNFVLDMQRALVGCNRMVAVLSPDYLTSGFTASEWATAFADDSTGLRQKLVPVRVRECKPDGLLANIVYIDLLSLTAANAVKALLTGVDRTPVDRTTPRPFPGISKDVGECKKRPPGMLPPIWNVPHLRNPNFIEPGQRLRELRDGLRSGRPGDFTRALAGLGGVGKTQLAVEYAYRHATDYALIWWLRAEQAETLAADYAALATKLALAEKEAKEQPVIVAAVRGALQRRYDWLLIFDNANAPEEIRSYLPGAGGHVLITSRHPGWGGIAKQMEIKKWPRDVAVGFLLKRTAQSDADAARELACELDHLPLALEQAAAYIDSAQHTLAGYLASAREMSLQNRFALFPHGPPSTDCPATVATTWVLSLQKLELESPPGVALLHLCAFFAPDKIPREVIVAGAENLPKLLRTAVSNPVSFDETVIAIRRYSLIESDRRDSTLSMHRLVQAVIRGRLEQAGRQHWAEIAVKLVNNAFPSDSDDVRTWKASDRLLPHAIATADFAENLGVGLEAAARLINQMGTYSWGRAEFGAAKAAFERALRIDEKIFGPDHHEVATDVNNLGSVLKDMGDLDGARAAFQRALQINEQVFGSNHPKVAVNVNNLGGVLQDLGDSDGAKAAFERALQIDEKTYGPDDSNVATDVNNLGSVLRTLGDLRGAETAFKRALSIAEKVFGRDHQQVAIYVNNLGLVMRDRGNLDGAKAAFERALRIGEMTLGLDHPKVAIRVNNLGTVLRALEDLPGAKAAFERALRIDEEALGPNHPGLTTDIDNLGTLLQELGDLSNAKAAFERALQIDENALGPDHPNVARDIYNLGGVLKALNDIRGARNAYQRALTIFRDFYGDEHPNTIAARENLEVLTS
jgi:tetratricopeptide (TPR) repeat protein